MLFNQIAKLQINDKIIEYPALYLEFTYKTDENESAILELNVYNLSDNTINSFKKEDPVIFQIGYDKDIGILTEGFISSIKTEGGVDKVTKIKVNETDLNFYKKIDKTYTKGTKASYIIQDICSNVGLYIKKIELLEDFSFENGYSQKGIALNLINNIVEKTGSKITIKGNKIYIYNKEEKGIEVIKLNYKSGLLKEPQKVEEEDKEYNYIVNSLPFYKLKIGDFIYVDSNKFKGTVKILKIEISGWEAKYYVGEVQ